MAIQQTNLPGVKLHARGKVRDIYDLGDHFLIVATDRLSAFDVVLPTPIPDKGKVLTQMSAFWFRHFKNEVPNHVVSTRVEDFPTPLHLYRDQLAGRHPTLVGLAHLGHQLTQRPLLPGNEVTPFVDGDEAYPAMIQAIDSAQRSVSLGTYIFDSGRVGDEFCHALARAQQRNKWLHEAGKLASAIRKKQTLS